jgi:hypothetical protein
MVERSAQEAVSSLEALLTLFQINAAGPATREAGDLTAENGKGRLADDLLDLKPKVDCFPCYRLSYAVERIHIEGAADVVSR